MIKIIMLLTAFALLPQFAFTQTIHDKIHPLVYLNSNGYFVKLKNQANTVGAKQFLSKKEKGKYVYNLLLKIAQESQQEVLQLAQQAEAYQPFVIVNAIWIKSDELLLEKIAQLDCVEAILPNLPLRNLRSTSNASIDLRSQTPEWGILKIQADQLWNQSYKGSGVIIGGQDTGYEWDHPSLKNSYAGWDGNQANHNYYWHDAIKSQLYSFTGTNPCGYDSKVPCDDNNHGTHTMGTMTGLDTNAVIGVAPEAKWIGCRNMDNGWGAPNTYIDCFEWFLAPTDTNGLNADPNKAPHVIANSWGCPTIEGCDSSNFELMRIAVENLRNAGVVVVVSAGNDGNRGCGSINSPAAIFQESFVVGASDPNDNLAGFSSRGPVTVDGSNRMKPDVVAPGVSVKSAIRGGGYASFNGTSMAGPHVAGAIALIISMQPNLAGNVDSIENLLRNTAIPIVTLDTCVSPSVNQIPNNLVGYGRIDLANIMNILVHEQKIDQSNSLLVYPNPSNQDFTIHSSEALGDCQLILSDIMGRQLVNKRIAFEKDFILQANTLAPGTYILELQNGSKHFVQKIQKL